MASDASIIHVSRLDAATRQLATAIRLYYDDGDPVSVHTLAKAAGEIIDRLCELNGTPAMRADMLEMIVPDKRRHVADKLNEAANAFKHASSKKPDKTPIEFSDEQNFFAILMAVDGLRLLGVDLIEAKSFGAWVRLVEPDMMLNPTEPAKLATIERLFGDITNQSRAAQKVVARDMLHLVKTGKLPT
jgi:hypothetical protein